MSAFGVFSFVEAAVLLVAAGVLFLVWARSEKKGFHLPGGDGTAIALAGGWALLLLVWRLFDKPDVTRRRAATIGIQWGMFAALLAAGALLAMGLRVRAVHRPEPPNPVADEPAPPPRCPAPAAPPRRPGRGHRGARRAAGLVGRAARAAGAQRRRPRGTDAADRGRRRAAVLSGLSRSDPPRPGRSAGFLDGPLRAR